ncbi:LexA family protein [Rufibacter sediminis]|uniref:Translesion error-prone DNA polymerase V autoproteolytic subunit n=1 Tax=Rufibacter sediminis TaxID=2762756 RepID=A0ABR6VMW9_9BACT|nr:translesion error-prone DNA polymerase V autoproteolytic subunit [Rufibacter sediminis]MBC3538498.1 translesion error-prone DNA polymerase V autoproteolytic subunit [Rufibacter sediminis]
MLVEELYAAEVDFAAFEMPLYGTLVPAGFPSPADDYLEAQLNLHSYLIPRPTTTFLVRVSGESMLKAGIRSGDLLVVDRSLRATDQRIVLAALNGEYTVKRYCEQGGKRFLKAENDLYPTIELRPEDDFSIWGVVTSVVHQF